MEKESFNKARLTKILRRLSAIEKGIRDKGEEAPMPCEDIIVAAEAQADDRTAAADQKLKGALTTS